MIWTKTYSNIISYTLSNCALIDLLSQQYFFCTKKRQAHLNPNPKIQIKNTYKYPPNQP